MDEFYAGFFLDAFRKEMRVMYENFTNKYKLSKTLRFGLIPQGETLRYIEERGLLEEDEFRAEMKKKVQALADGYHRAFIDKTLGNLHLEGVEDYADIYLYPEGYDDAAESLRVVTESLIGQVSAALTGAPEFKRMFSNKLWKEILPEFYADDKDALSAIDFFDGFSSYFVGYYNVRKFIYDDSGNIGTVGSRVVNDNLPVFIVNRERFRKISDVLTSEMKVAERELQMFLSGDDLSFSFSLDGFDAVITQTGIDRYNQIIGGYTKEDGAKVRGINEYVSMHNQNVGDGRERLPLLTQLKKQILSERETMSFVPEAFTGDEQVIDAMRSFDALLEPAENRLINTFMHISSFDTDRVYVKTSELREISDKVFGSWRYIDGLISERYDRDTGASEKERKTKKYEAEKKKTLKAAAAYSVAELDNLPGVDGKVSSYIEGAAGFHKLAIDTARKEMREKAVVKEDRSLKRNMPAKAAIKGYLDAVTDLRRFAGMFMVREPGRDAFFYSEVEPEYDVLASVTRLYNKTRNYLSGKLYVDEKIKLNFGSSVLLGGWSESVEDTKLGTLLFRDGRYYLGIIAKGQGKLFASVPDAETDDVYMKMRYNLISGANKSLPHIFFSGSGIETYKPSDEIIRIYRSGSFKKGKSFSLEDCHKLIDYYKDCISRYPAWECFDFSFSDTESYEDISGFFREVDLGGYSLRYRNIDKSVIESLVEDGRLYLFEIWHKDFSPKSKGRPDLSTMYWRAVFDPRNEENLVFKLNGGAEVFYRKASIKDRDVIRHKAGDTVYAKNPLSKRRSRVLKYDIVKDRRFTVDHFQLNVPITINAAAPDFAMLNTEAKMAINAAGVPHVIGVSRGENSLLYIAVIDQEGKVIESKSLNVIGGTDYARLLAEREAARDAGRKGWDEIEGIKQLKDGYIGQVVRELADLMLKYDAVIAIEDLSARFKQSRQKIEKAVYQQLEEKLIRKLNFLVNKDAAPGEPGEPFMAYQLTSVFQSFEKLGKQTGFIFYVSPWNTTGIDPTTGFVNRFNTKYSNRQAAQTFWNTFDAITYDETVGAYRFDFSYKHFAREGDAELLDGTRTEWSLYSHGKRASYERTDKGMKRVVYDLTESMTELFEEYHAFDADDLKKAICSINDKDFHERLLMLFGLMVRLISDGEIISPVMNVKGEFFRGAADANGAYNIARKGLILVERIVAADEETLLAKGRDGISLTVTGNEWLKYAQQ